MAKKPFSINRVKSGLTVFNVMALGDATYIESSLIVSRALPLFVGDAPPLFVGDMNKPEAYFGLKPISQSDKSKVDFPELDRAFFFYENNDEEKASGCYHRSFFSRKKAESYKKLCIKLNIDSTCNDDFNVSYD